jgi:hypothetical protein
VRIARVAVSVVMLIAIGAGIVAGTRLYALFAGG